MTKIKVLQFAILAEEVEQSYRIEAGMRLKHNIKENAIAVDMIFTFSGESQKAILLQVVCEFTLHPDDMAGLTANGKVTVPKSTLDYFVAQTVGTARGILHCKTEGTPFNGIIIPPMDVTDMVTSDLVIEVKE